MMVTNWGRFKTLLIILVITIMTSCDLSKPIKVGFSGQLTGPHANMGVNGRDGVLLAIDEINAAGGIAGRKIVLLARDDLGTSEGARIADQELIDAGVVAIIGHMTSGQTMAVIPVVEAAKMVLLAPTTSTPTLTGKVDHFFRVIPDSVQEATLLANHVKKQVGVEHIAAIYDNSNSAYTRTYLDAFREEFQKKGGKLVEVVGYSSADKAHFGPLISQLRKADPQGLLIISSAYDCARIAQQTRILDWGIQLFGSGWARALPLIEYGGRAVEGMHVIHYHDPNSQAPRYLSFKKNYFEKFKQEPSFMASNAYEAMQMLATALEKTGGRAEDLIKILPGSNIMGLTQPVSIDKYGDGVRLHYQFVVQDGRFVTKRKVE